MLELVLGLSTFLPASVFFRMSLQLPGLVAQRQSVTGSHAALRMTNPSLSATDVFFSNEIAALRKPGVGRHTRLAPQRAAELPPAPPHPPVASRLHGRSASTKSSTLAEYSEELAVELVAKRRLVTLRRETRRSSSEASLLREGARRRALAASVRSQLNEIRGSKLSGDFDVEPASEAAVCEMADSLMGALALVEPDENARGWYKLYRHIDADGNGRVEFNELCRVIRDHLNLDPSALSDQTIQAFWLAVDTDRSGWVGQG